MTSRAPDPRPEARVAPRPGADESRLLRAIDWRFLVPPRGDPAGPRRIVLVGGTDLAEAALRRAGPGDDVLRERCAPGTADLVVVFRGANPRVAEVAAMVRPGGTLLWEVTRRNPLSLFRSPRAVRATVRRHGLEPIETYWVTSGRVGPSMYLPLGIDGAVAWYFETHQGMSSRLRRTLGLVLRRLARGRSSRLERLVPSYVVIARRSATGASAAGIGATALAAPALPEWARRPEMRPIVLAGGEGPWSRTVLLPFEPDGSIPTGVIKVARSPSYAEHLGREQATLVRVRGLIPGELASAVPEPLGSFHLLGQAASAESYRSGASIGVRMRRPGSTAASRRDDLERAARWLRDFHDATAESTTTLGPGGFDVGALLDRYVAVFGETGRETRLFERIRAAADDPGSAPIARVTHHRDFGPWNVLVDGHDAISVIDWEMAGIGPPLVDLVYFVAHWCWLAAGSNSEMEQLEVLRRLLTGDRADATTSVARSTLGRQARLLGFAPGTVAGLVTWCFVEQALDRHDRLATIGEPSAADRSSNRYVQCVAALAGLPDLGGDVARMLATAGDRQ